jgi:hypothetical protein
MKKIIDIIKETEGNDLVVARYNKDIENNLFTDLSCEIPEIGDVVTNGSQDMEVSEYIVIDASVGVKFENFPATVAATQMAQMLADGVVWIKK